MKRFCWALLLAVGCAAHGPLRPPETELDRAQTALRDIHPGDPQDKVLAAFQPVKKYEKDYMGRVGVIDMQSYEDEGGKRYTLWIGY